MNHSFGHATRDGEKPEGDLLAAGSLHYGTTYWGGAHNLGTLYQFETNGYRYRLLHSFSRSDGAHPKGNVVFYNGYVYGTTQWGGKDDKGTVFRYGPVATQ